MLSAPICDVDVVGQSGAALRTPGHQRPAGPVQPAGQGCPGRRASFWPARSGSISCGRSSRRACTATNAAGRSGSSSTGVPLFIAGGAVCYLILPRTTKLLLGFTPDQVGSIVDFNDFLSIVMRLMLVFGLAFEVPVFVVLLNLVGVLPARKLAGWWRQIILGVFLFAAIATPTGDPFTMTVLAVPLLRPR